MTEAEFILANTAPAHAPLVPEILLRLATEITPIWQATEAWLDQANIAPPFWAFAWPGSQVLARTLLDRPALAAGQRVLDFACGCGLAAIAAARAGAERSEAAEIDPLAVAATRLNAGLNGATVHALARDVVGEAGPWDLILCGDVCYEAAMARRVLPWLQARAMAGVEVWIADPGRAYFPQAGLPRAGMEEIACHAVPTSLELEDTAERLTRLFRLLPQACLPAAPALL